MSYPNNEQIIHNRSNLQSSYLWGSSSVWQPWTPDISRTSTRTPPGLRYTREVEEENVREFLRYKKIL